MKKNWILIVVILLIVILVFRRITKPEEPQQKQLTPQKPSSTDSAALPIVGADTELMKGMVAKEIRDLQEDYNNRYADRYNYPKIGVDGKFGPETEAAVLKVMEKKTTTLNEFKDELNPIQLAWNIFT